MAAQICQAIAYIHGQGITHRDLKPENIILTSTTPPICKVADFGLSKIVDDVTFLKTTCGTPAYLAPEVMLRMDIQRDPYTDKVDSFSLGVILFCMLVPARKFLLLITDICSVADFLTGSLTVTHFLLVTSIIVGMKTSGKLGLKIVKFNGISLWNAPVISLKMVR
jgi:serine/threonine protein kinase